MGRALRHRNYRLFFCGQSISLIGTWLTRTATSWLVYQLSHSAMTLGVVSFASLIPAFLLTPLAGVLVDRSDKHRVLVATQICAAVQSALLAAVTLSGLATIPLLLALNVFQGLINAFDIPVRQSFVVQMIDDKADLPNAIALNSTMVNLARLIGPSVAGILIATVREGGCFAIDAVSYLAVIATLLMMTISPRERRTGPQKHLIVDFKEGFAYVRQSRTIVSILLLFALVSLMGVPYMTLLPMIVGERFSGGAKDLGYLTAASGFGAVIGALYLSSRKSAEGLSSIVWKAAFGFGIGLILLGLVRGYSASMLTMLGSGMGMMLQMAASNTALQTVVEEDKRGRVMSLFAMAYTGMAPFGSLMGGYLADRIGPSATLEWGGVACCLGAVWLWRTLSVSGRLQTAAANAGV